MNTEIKQKRHIEFCRKRILISFMLVFFLQVAQVYGREPVIVDHHSVAEFQTIPRIWIEKSKQILHIAYQHTSHGSQLVSGMSLLDKYMNQKGIYIFNNGGLGGALDLHDNAMESYYPEGEASDLGYYPDWIITTRNYLNAVENKDVNVIMWSWCSLHASEGAILGEYLPAMEQLEIEYPNIKFIYMTGHADGGGEEGAVHIWNSVIRQYCIDHGKYLYDFYDIEMYNPDGDYFGDKLVKDTCDYDGDGDGIRESNWAIEWQQSHLENTDWYSCSCSHSESLNCNQKAKTAWYLFARLAGWEGCPAVLGDINGDCRIDALDFVELSNNWLLDESDQYLNPVADIAPDGGNGIVDLQDFAVLSHSWNYANCGAYFASDFNRDCRVGWEDLVLVAEAWLSESGQSGWNERCDIYPMGGDQKIDFKDFAVLANDWMKEY